MGVAKSFVLNVAKTEKPKSWQQSGADSIASCPKPNGSDPCGGCTLVDFGWGQEPTTTHGVGGDGPMFC